MAGRARGSVRTRVLDRARRDRGVGLATAVAMVLLVAAVYAAAVGVAALFGRTGPPGLALSILATAVVALAFEPVRTRTRRALQRLLHVDGRSRAQLLAGFADSVAGRYPIAELPEHIAAVVGEGTGALRTEVWLVVNGRLDLAAAWSADRGQPPGAGSAEHSLDVRDRGELLGRLTVITTADHRLTVTERRLVEGVAARSGMLLRVAGLRVELQRRLTDLQRRSTELRQSRRDLVARQDAERKRLERNIHDGAQQEVIALLVNLRLVQTLLDRAPDRATGLLDAQDEVIRSTISTLQELARGLYPRALTEHGPVAALRQVAERSPVRVTVTADDLPRLPTDIEAALYFCCVEALQNSAKHASAGHVEIVVGSAPAGGVHIEIHDDGVGFEPDLVARGRGLANVRDRVESLGGWLLVTSTTGTGTALEIEIPIERVPAMGVG